MRPDPHLLSKARTPSLHFEGYVVRGQKNELPHAIYLPALLTSEAKVVGGNEDVVLTIPGLEGFRMTVKANSVTFPDGSRTGTLVVSPVTADKLPMAPPAGGAQFGVPAWTIQPAGARFDPPIEVRMPNSTNELPGDNLPVVQWDHDLSQYVPMGRATVSSDGAWLTTDAGSGVTKAGWGGLCRYDDCKTAATKCGDCEKIDASGKCPTCAPDATKSSSKCDDKDSCTAEDKCTGGVCMGTPIEVRITAAASSICVGRSKVFAAIITPSGRTPIWRSSVGITVAGGTVRGVSRGTATVFAEDAECKKAVDSRSVRVIDKEYIEAGTGEVTTCLVYPLACITARDYRDRIDPPTDQGKPTWVSTNFKGSKPGQCRANREGSEMDAATHAYLSCSLYRELDPAAAKAILDSHEFGHPEDTCESHEMDFNNNDIGKNMAKQPGDCSKQVFDALNSGRLFVNNPFKPGVCTWTGKTP